MAIIRETPEQRAIRLADEWNLAALDRGGHAGRPVRWWRQGKEAESAARSGVTSGPAFAVGDEALVPLKGVRAPVRRQRVELARDALPKTWTRAR